jgi:hypothetical protein
MLFNDECNIKILWLQMGKDVLEMNNTGPVFCPVRGSQVLVIDPSID